MLNEKAIANPIIHPIQLSLDVSPELDRALNDVAHKLNGDLAEVLLKAIALSDERSHCCS